MSFEKKYKVTSLRHPDKVYTSTDEFWTDCEPEVTNAATTNASWKESGKILETLSTLDEGGKSLTYTKVYLNEETWNEYRAECESAITENLTVCDFTEI